MPIADLPPVDEAAMAALSDMVVESCQAAQVEIHHLGIRKEALTDGVSFRWSGKACRNNPRLNLSVVTESGLAKTLVVQPSLTIWVHAPVAPEFIDKGHMVKPTLALVDLSKISGIPVPTGGEARVPILPGKPITTMNVREPYDAKMGHDVTLEVVRGVIHLKTNGRLLNNARIGDEVRVVNHQTNALVKGVLIAPSVVRLQ